MDLVQIEKNVNRKTKENRECGEGRRGYLEEEEAGSRWNRRVEQ